MPDCNNCGHPLSDCDAIEFQEYAYEAHNNLYSDIEDVPFDWREDCVAVPNGPITKYKCPNCDDDYCVEENLWMEEE